MNEQEKKLLRYEAAKLTAQLDKEEKVMNETISAFSNDAEMMKIMRDIKHNIMEGREIVKEMLDTSKDV